MLKIIQSVVFTAMLCMFAVGCTDNNPNGSDSGEVTATATPMPTPTPTPTPVPVLVTLTRIIPEPDPVLETYVNEAMYAEVFENLRRDLQNGEYHYYVRDNLAESMSDFSYAFYDIDGNGVDELILKTEGYGGCVYTLDKISDTDTQPVLLVNYSGSNNGFNNINELGYIFGHYSKGYYYYYEDIYKIAPDGVSVTQDTILTDMTVYLRSKYTLTPFGNSARSLTTDEYRDYWDNIYAPIVELDMLPLTESTSSLTLKDLFPPGPAAIPSVVIVFVEKLPARLVAYDIDGTNYFKLRDIAFILNRTDAQFSIDESDDKITLGFNLPYTQTGGEMMQTAVVHEATPVEWEAIVDGRTKNFDSYIIGDDIYFTAQDLAALLGITLK